MTAYVVVETCDLKVVSSKLGLASEIKVKVQSTGFTISRIIPPPPHPTPLIYTFICTSVVKYNFINDLTFKYKNW